MGPAGKLPTTDFEHFLMACIAAMGDNVRPNFQEVAAATGMSKGGVSNKYLGSLKMYREANQAAGATTTGVLPAAAAPKAAKKRKAKTDDEKTKAKKAKVEDEDDGEA